MLDYKSRVGDLVDKTEQYRKIRKEPEFVIEKKGRVVFKSDFAPEINGEYTASGKFYPIVPDDFMGKRTVFKKDPIKIKSELYYLELKGYGRDGKELYFQEHSSGDIFYGMYLDLAVQEYERATVAMNLNLPVTLPVAVIEIPRDEYIRTGVIGFQGTLKALLCSRLSFDDPYKVLRLIENNVEDDILRVIKEDSTLASNFLIENAEVVSKDLITLASDKYEGDLEEGIRYLITELKNDASEDWRPGINDKADALLSRKPIGYYVRASKCPIRVGDPQDRDMDISEFHKIAKQMGRTFRVLLENKILHHCPGTGNWTIAGELTDFADTFDLETQQQELTEHMKLLNKDLSEFIRYLIGPEHTGVLCESFVEGLYGTKLTLDQAVEKLSELF